MLRYLAIVGLLSLLAMRSAAATEPADPSSNELPAPLDSIAADLSPIENLFQVVDVRLYAPDEFSVGDPGRVVAEETLVWTLEAKVPVTGAQVYRLFHNPRPQVTFFSRADGQEVKADARSEGYQLICDLRWFRLRPAGEDLAQGDTLKVWVHLGKEGSSGLVANKANSMTLKMD